MLGLVVSCLVALGVGGAPSSGGEGDPPCDPGPGSAPDPRCGENLDGRERAPSSAWLVVPRTVLWVPRAASRAVFYPVIGTSDFIERHRIPNWIEALLTTDDGLVGVRPDLLYSTSFLPTGGLRFFYRRLPGVGSEISSRFRTGGPGATFAEVSAGAPAWTGLGVRAFWDHRDDRLFAGIGPNSREDLQAAGQGLARFGSDVLLAEARWSTRLPAHFLAALHVDAQRRDYRAAGVRGGPSIATFYGLPAPGCDPSAYTNACVDPALVPGFASGLRIAHVGASVGWDLRNHARDGGGLSLFVDGRYGHGLAGDPSRHALLSGEMVLAVGATDRVFLVRGRAAIVERLASAAVPFEELVLASGSAGIRGFPEGRFRGASALVGTAEYRWYIAHNLDASLFADVGTVAGPAFSGLRRDRWFPSFGVGLRLFKLSGPHWTADVDSGVQLAYAPDDGFRVLLRVAPF